MTKLSKILSLVVIGCLVLSSGVALKVLAGSGYAEPNQEGEPLDLTNYGFLRDGDRARGMGVFLGTYAIGAAHCEYLREVGTHLQCYQNIGGEYFTGTEVSSGFGLLFLEYPGNCAGGQCLMTSRISILLPVGDYDNGTMEWKKYILNGASSETGHIYTSDPEGGVYDLDEVDIRQVLADFDALSGLDPE